LNDGDTLTDTFTAVSSDGTGTQVVTVTINGQNDAPVFTATTGIGFTGIDIDTNRQGEVEIFAIDLDSDGDIDVLSTEYIGGGNGTLSWFENDGNMGNPSFTENIIDSNLRRSLTVFAIDIDGDGNIDVLSASEIDDTVVWYQNNGVVGNPSFTKNIIDINADSAQTVFAIDIDGDGDIDLLSGNGAAGTIAWYQNDGAEGTPGFTKRVISSTVNVARSIFAIDVDGDGDIDVLSASQVDSTIAWHENDGVVGDPSFTKNIIDSEANKVFSLFAIDVDDDGDIDVLSADYDNDSIIWYENNSAEGTPVFTKQVITSSAHGAYSVFAVDVDGDGDIDVLSTSLFDDTVAWYENDGAVNPNFTENIVTTTADGALGIFAVDVDGDGDMDVLSHNIYGRNLSWYKNEGRFNFSLPENTTFVANILATDADGDNISYGTSESADQALFNIDSTTGDLSFITPPDFEVPGSANGDNTYNITVTASANGYVVSSTVVVVVTDEEEMEVSDINPPGTTLIASSAFVDPSPPEGWTQCAGYTNTEGDDVSGEVLDGCLPFDGLRVRLYNESGILVDDLFGSGFTVTTFDSSAYITSGARTTVTRTHYTGSAGLFSRNPFGGTVIDPMFSTGNGGPSIIPDNGTHNAEIAVGGPDVTNGMIGYTVAVYRADNMEEVF
jgi:hypothetical protein